MRNIISGLAFSALLCGGVALAGTGIPLQESNTMKTNNGTLSIVHKAGINAIEINGPAGNGVVWKNHTIATVRDSVNLKFVYYHQATDSVLLEENIDRQFCPYKYRFLQLSNNEPPLVSASFGNCTKLQADNAHLNADVLALNFPAAKVNGKPHTAANIIYDANGAKEIINFTTPDKEPIKLLVR